MKLRYLFALPLFVAAFTACDDIEYSDAKPVENPQLPLVEASSFTVTPSSTLTAGLNLDALQAAAGDADYTTYMVPLYSVTSSEELPGEDTFITGGFELSATDDFENPIDVEGIVFNEGAATAPLSSLLTARSTMYGKNPTAQTVYYRIPVYVNYAGGEYRLGSADYFYCNGNSFQETGTDPGYTVEDAYYILGPDGTSLADAIALEHGDGSVWDNPVFTARVNADNDFTWVIVPESAYTAAGTGSVDNSKVYGPTTATAPEGTLVLGNAAGTMTAGKYNLTIDLSTLSYSFVEVVVPDWLGTPNDSQGWDSGSSQKLGLYGEATFLGYSWFGGEWGGKITTDEGTWCGIDQPMELNEDTGVYTGTLIVGGGGNILEGEPAALYFFNVNWDTMEFTMTPVATIGLVGGFNGWNADDPVTLTPSADKLTWTGTVTFDTADEFKFIANTGWGIELGDSNGDLVCDRGDNVKVEAGTYTVLVDLTALPYSLTMTAQ